MRVARPVWPGHNGPLRQNGVRMRKTFAILATTAVLAGAASTRADASIAGLRCSVYGKRTSSGGRRYVCDEHGVGSKRRLTWDKYLLDESDYFPMGAAPPSVRARYLREIHTFDDTADLSDVQAFNGADLACLFYARNYNGTTGLELVLDVSIELEDSFDKAFANTIALVAARRACPQTAISAGYDPEVK